MTCTRCLPDKPCFNEYIEDLGKELPTKTMPSQDELRRAFDYDPDLGVLYWKKRPYEDGASYRENRAISTFNTSHAGRPALNNVNKSRGYRAGSYLRKNFYAHRIIWKWMTGEEPRQVDHINGDRSDNRWENLREVSLAENRKNTGLRSNNKSGVAGVHWSKKCGRWVAQIRYDGKLHHLGSFRTKEAAARVRKIAEQRRGFHENHGTERELWTC